MSYSIQNFVTTPGIAGGAYSGSYCTVDYLEITGLKKECGGSNQGVNRVCGYAYNIELGNLISASSLCGMYIPSFCLPKEYQLVNCKDAYWALFRKSGCAIKLIV